MKKTGLSLRRPAAAFSLALSILAPLPAMAHEQVGFSVRNSGGGKEFSYRLRDEYSGDVTPLSFTLRRTDLADMSAGLRPMADVQKAAAPKLEAYGNRRCGELSARFNQRASCSVSVSANGAVQIDEHFRSGVDRPAFEREVKNLLGELNTMRQKSLEAGAYSIERDGQTMIARPDYTLIAKNSVSALAPIARAVKAMDMPIAGTSSRLRVSLARAIAFMQAIPYEALGAQRSTGMGYLPPLAVIDENRGDCDSKSVAYAALARTLAPGTPVAIIIVPGHALIGLGISIQPGDATLTQGGLTYVLAEPVGPAPARIGEIGPISQAALKRKSGVRLIRVF